MSYNSRRKFAVEECPYLSSIRSLTAPTVPLPKDLASRMSLKVCINGTLVDKEFATVSVFDHGLLYGDGVFEGLRCYSGKVFRLQEHLKRLYESALAIHLTIPIAIDELAADVNKTLAANQMRDGYVRLVVTRGSGTLGLDPNRCSHPQIIIIADHITMYPAEMYANGMEIVTASTMRNHPQPSARESSR